jgi:hypothetical protein
VASIDDPDGVWLTPRKRVADDRHLPGDAVVDALREKLGEFARELRGDLLGNFGSG